MVLILNHFERAVALLVEQFRKQKPDGSLTNLQKVIKALVEPLQELEDVNYELLTERWLSTAVGVQLDKLGNILGLPRNPGESDESYRQRLMFQVFINISNGTPEEVSNLAVFLTKATYVRFFDVFPAFFQLEINSLPELMPNPWNALNEAIKDISPAGVNYAPVTNTLNVPIPFQFGGEQRVDPFYVEPVEGELHDFEVDAPTPFQLYVSIGNPEDTGIIGGFEELGFPNPEAGQIAELIQIDGQSPARRFY